MAKVLAWDEEGASAPWVPPFVEPLTAADYASLTSGRNVMVRHQRASLAARRVHRHGLDPELRFLLAGPSGEHGLLVDATPLARLNAHWIVFASHPANQ